MKKCICLMISIVLLLSLFQYTIYAESMEEDAAITVRLATAPIVSRSTSDFIEGATGSLHFEFEFMIGYDSIVQRETIYYECVYITVPDTNERVEAYKILNDFGAVTISGLNMYVSGIYPDANIIEGASHFYNCHSYAWYSDDPETNCYWIDDPGNFYTNNENYIEVYSPAVGDIICYYDGNDNIHSGVVQSVNNYSSNSVRVVSKWGYWGLYGHDSNDCPYELTESGAQTVIKYYRYHPIHNYKYRINQSNFSVHIATCSTCGYSTIENHTYRSLPSGGSRCTKCGYTSNGQIIMSDTPKPVAQ